MSMRDYPISGYGIGISWNDREALLRLLTMDLIKDKWDEELELVEDEDSNNDIRLESFMEDPQMSLEMITELLNEEIQKEFSNEDSAIGYETANDDYIFIMFYDVKYGTTTELTTTDVNKIIKELALKVFDISEETINDIGIDSYISSRSGIYGDIFETYCG